MTDEIYEIQWLGHEPYLVYQNFNESDDCIVIHLTDAQKQAVEEFESRQLLEKRNFCEQLTLEGNQ